MAFSIRIFNNLGMIRRHMILGIAGAGAKKKHAKKGNYQLDVEHMYKF